MRRRPAPSTSKEMFLWERCFILTISAKTGKVDLQPSAGPRPGRDSARVVAKPAMTPEKLANWPSIARHCPFTASVQFQFGHLPPTESAVWNPDTAPWSELRRAPAGTGFVPTRRRRPGIVSRMSGEDREAPAL